MAEDIEEQEEAPAKKSKMPLIIGLVLALAGGGGGFYATWSGMILAPPEESAPAVEEELVTSIGDIAFVEIDPVIVALTGKTDSSHLQFRAQLEVPGPYKADVELLLPRVVDVLNSYLRALHAADIEDPSALTRIRSQMLRRIQIVTGQGRVNDLLIMEFVIN